MAATEAAPRVALLARAGEACDRISSALHEAGAEVVLVADPSQADPSAVRDAAPEAILVALDPQIEDAVDAYGDVLADPAYMVIFEEAEQAAQRSGWDAARWLRHLAAKLHRHQNVLPAGTEAEADELQLTPGQPQATGVVVDLDEAIVAVTDEAQSLADDVPNDSGLDGLSGQPEWTLDDLSADPAGLADDLEVAALLDESDVVDAPARLTVAPDAELTLDEESDLRFAIAGLPMGDDEAEGFSFDAGRFDRADAIGEASGGIDEFLATHAPRETGSTDAGGTAGASQEEAAIDSAPPVAEDFGGLRLVDEDSPVVEPAPVKAPSVANLDLRTLGGGLSLADPDSYGHGPVRGAVLIEAGLGGPDAVRQLLAAIPEGFPRPILIRLQLDGGRYDRLVKQMKRATPAQVVVAEDGMALEPGSVHFLPPGLGLKVSGARRTFDAATEFEPESSLPADDSAVLFLSGADAAMVSRLTDGRWTGGLVLGQTPDESCYEPAAAKAAVAAGAAHGSLATLARMLLDRWPPPGHHAGEDINGMLPP